MKRTFVVPEEKEEVYAKFKALVPEVSSQLVDFMEEYVRKQEALAEKMIEQTIYNGTDYVDHDIFKGDVLKFYGTRISEGITYDDAYIHVSKKVYLTRKGKFLVSVQTTNKDEGEYVYSYDTYEDYFSMKEKAELSNDIISQCEVWLKKESTIRTFKVLDV